MAGERRSDRRGSMLSEVEALREFWELRLDPMYRGRGIPPRRWAPGAHTSLACSATTSTCSQSVAGCGASATCHASQPC